jgi:hypothetical protein
MKMTPLAILIAIFSVSVARSAIIVSGDVNDTQATCSITFTSDISYNLTGGSPFGFQLVFKDWVTTSNGLPTLASIQSPVPFEISGVANNVTVPLLQPDRNTTTIDLTPTDGTLVFTFDGGTTQGEVITIEAGTYTFHGLMFLNPQMVQTFTGDTFLADFNGGAISQTVAVPEPSLTMLLGCMGAGLLHRRRRA